MERVLCIFTGMGHIVKNKENKPVKVKGGAKALTRRRLQYLVAMIDADVPNDEILKACDAVVAAIRNYKQVLAELELQTKFPHRITIRRKKMVSRSYRHVDDQPHEAKYLRECKRLDVDPE